MRTRTTTLLGAALVAGLALAGGTALAHGWGPGFGHGYGHGHGPGMGQMRHQVANCLQTGAGITPQARWQDCPRAGHRMGGGPGFGPRDGSGIGPRDGTGPRARMGLCPNAQPDAATPAPEAEPAG